MVTQDYLVLWCLVCVVGCGPTMAATSQPVQTEEQRSDDGRLRLQRSYYVDKNGQKVPHGPETTWFPNGQRACLVSYRDGKLEGLLTEWSASGQKLREGLFLDNKETGLWQGWQPSGELAWSCVLNQGSIVGSKTYWYPNGKHSREEAFGKDGMLESITQWSESGQKLLQGAYSRGKKDGRWVYWDEKGAVEADGIWKNGSPWDGMCAVESLRGGASVPPSAKLVRYREGKAVEEVPATRATTAHE